MPEFHLQRWLVMRKAFRRAGYTSLSFAAQDAATHVITVCGKLTINNIFLTIGMTALELASGVLLRPKI